jgi:hypothetical protein
MVGPSGCDWRRPNARMLLRPDSRRQEVRDKNEQQYA